MTQLDEQTPSSIGGAVPDCSQVNNPCNGFDPAPIRALAWEGPRWNDPSPRAGA